MRSKERRSNFSTGAATCVDEAIKEDKMLPRDRHVAAKFHVCLVRLMQQGIEVLEIDRSSK